MEVMSRKLEGGHVGFLIKLTRNNPKRQRDRTWRSESSTKVLKEARNQTLGAYIDKRQETVAEWVALRPMLEICDRKMGYK